MRNHVFVSVLFLVMGSGDVLIAINLIVKLLSQKFDKLTWDFLGVFPVTLNAVSG